MLKLTLVVSSILVDLIADEISVRFSGGGAEAVAEAVPVVVWDLLSLLSAPLVWAFILPLLVSVSVLLDLSIWDLSVWDLSIVLFDLSCADLSCAPWACSPFAAPAFSSAAFLFIAPDLSIPPDDFSSAAPPDFMAPPVGPTVPFS